MRLWTLHPKYLDRQGLTAVWREGLLAQAVLAGKTRGYKNHPQLDRFKAKWNALSFMAAYLAGIAAEAEARGYSFDARKIGRARSRSKIKVTTGQVEYECAHLLGKLRRRDPKRAKSFSAQKKITLHPLFVRTPGPVEPWERPR